MGIDILQIHFFFLSLGLIPFLLLWDGVSLLLIQQLVLWKWICEALEAAKVATSSSRSVNSCAPHHNTGRFVGQKNELAGWACEVAAFTRSQTTSGQFLASLGLMLLPHAVEPTSMCPGF